MLQALLAEQLVVRAAMKDFSALSAEGEVSLPAGSMVVAAGLQQQSDWFARLQRVQQRFTLPLQAIRSGLTPTGSDLGSHNFSPVQMPTVLLLAGPGMSSTEAGEAWYNLERLAGISPSMAEPQRLAQLDLSRYSHIILPDGNYRSWQDTEVTKLRQWLEQGGVLWGHKGGAAWLARVGLLKTGVWQGEEMSSLIPADAEHPAQAVLEASRVLRPGGRLLLTSLAKHEHRTAVEGFGHVNLGFSEKELTRFASRAGFDIVSCETVTRERRPPHFEVIALIARKPLVAR